MILIDPTPPIIDVQERPRRRAERQITHSCGCQVNYDVIISTECCSYKEMLDAVDEMVEEMSLTPCRVCLRNSVSAGDGRKAK
jgi:hypothetical protein